MRDKTNKTKKGQTLMNTMKKDKKMMKLVKEDISMSFNLENLFFKKLYVPPVDRTVILNFKK